MSLQSYSTERRYYIWKTKDPFVNRCMQSPYFSIRGNENRFCLAAYKNYNDRKEWQLFIIHHSTNLWKCQITIHIQYRNGRLFLLKSTENISSQYYRYHTEYWTPVWNGTEFGCLSDSQGYIVDGKLTFIFIFDDLMEFISDIVIGDKQIETLCSYEFSMDIEKLLDDYIHTDVVLKCEDELIPVHRIILETRSEVFFQMFRRGKKDSRFLDITDMDLTTLHKFLKFLYSGKIDLCSMKEAFELYRVAEMYWVRTLRQTCASFMVQNFRVNNVCRVLRLADICDDIALLNAATLFAASQEDFLSSAEWIVLSAEDTELAVKVFNEILDFSYANS